jgi:SAM-dependent methyltransferase
VAVYLRLPAMGEADLVASVTERGATVLELGCGVGRVTHALVDSGFVVTAVDESAEMLAHVRGATTVQADVATLALDETFDCVLLASHFVNTGDDAERAAILAACARHVASDGVVVVQAYPPELDWTPGRETALGDVIVRLAEAEQSGPRVRATMEYELDGDRWRQTFEAVLLSEDALARELERASLRFDRWLDDAHGWLVARPA